MNSLIQINNGQAVVSSRQVAEHFGKLHKDVLEQINKIKAENSAVIQMFFQTTYQAGTGKNYPMYLMNRDGFTLLAMGFTGSKALEWKLRYIHAFNEMEARLACEAAGLPDFTNPVIAARAWADQAEGRQIAEAKVVTLTPKAEYYDQLVDCGHATGFRDTAKELGVGQKQLMKFLETNGYIFRDSHGRPKPYMKHMDLFVVKDYASDKHSGSRVLVSVVGKQRFNKEIPRA